jgi:excisionase family DNA binding protein
MRVRLVDLHGSGYAVNVEVSTTALLMPMVEAVKFLGLGERTMWRLVKLKKIPHVRIGRRVMFRREALAAWAKSQEVQR